MTQTELVRFCRACVHDGRPEALDLGRRAFLRLAARRAARNGKTC